MDSLALPLSKVSALYAQIEARESSIATSSAQVAFYNDKIKEQQKVFDEEMKTKEERLQTVGSLDERLERKKRDSYAAIVCEVNMCKSLPLARRNEIENFEKFLSSSAQRVQGLMEDLSSSLGTIRSNIDCTRNAQDEVRHQLINAQEFRRQLAADQSDLRDLRESLNEVEEQKAIVTEELLRTSANLENIRADIADMEATLQSKLRERQRLNQMEVDLRKAQQTAVSERETLQSSLNSVRLLSQNERARHHRLIAEISMKEAEARVVTAAVVSRMEVAGRSYSDHTKEIARRRLQLQNAQKKKALLDSENQKALLEKISLLALLESLEQQTNSMSDSDQSVGAEDVENLKNELKLLEQQTKETSTALESLNADIANLRNTEEIQELIEEERKVQEEVLAIGETSRAREAMVATLQKTFQTSSQALEDLQKDVNSLEQRKMEIEKETAARTSAFREEYDEQERVSSQERNLRIELEKHAVELDEQITALEAEIDRRQNELARSCSESRETITRLQKQLSSSSKLVVKARRRWRRNKKTSLEEHLKGVDLQANLQSIIAEVQEQRRLLSQ